MKRYKYDNVDPSTGTTSDVAGEQTAASLSLHSDEKARTSNLPGTSVSKVPNLRQDLDKNENADIHAAPYGSLDAKTTGKAKFKSQKEDLNIRSEQATLGIYPKEVPKTIQRDLVRDGSLLEREANGSNSGGKVTMMDAHAVEGHSKQLKATAQRTPCHEPESSRAMHTVAHFDQDDSVCKKTVQDEASSKKGNAGASSEGNGSRKEQSEGTDGRSCGDQQISKVHSRQKSSDKHNVNLTDSERHAITPYPSHTTGVITLPTQHLDSANQPKLGKDDVSSPKRHRKQEVSQTLHEDDSHPEQRNLEGPEDDDEEPMSLESSIEEDSVLDASEELFDDSFAPSDPKIGTIDTKLENKASKNSSTTQVKNTQDVFPDSLKSKVEIPSEALSKPPSNDEEREIFEVGTCSRQEADSPSAQGPKWPRIHKMASKMKRSISASRREDETVRVGLKGEQSVGRINKRMSEMVDTENKFESKSKHFMCKENKNSDTKDECLPSGTNKRTEEQGNNLRRIEGDAENKRKNETQHSVVNENEVESKSKNFTQKLIKKSDTKDKHLPSGPSKRIEEQGSYVCASNSSLTVTTKKLLTEADKNERQVNKKAESPLRSAHQDGKQTALKKSKNKLEKLRIIEPEDGIETTMEEDTSSKCSVPDQQHCTKTQLPSKPKHELKDQEEQQTLIETSMKDSKCHTPRNKKSKFSDSPRASCKTSQDEFRSPSKHKTSKTKSWDSNTETPSRKRQAENVLDISQHKKHRGNNVESGKPIEKQPIDEKRVNLDPSKGQEVSSKEILKADDAKVNGGHTAEGRVSPGSKTQTPRKKHKKSSKLDSEDKARSTPRKSCSSPVKSATPKSKKRKSKHSDTKGVRKNSEEVTSSSGSKCNQKTTDVLEHTESLSTKTSFCFKSKKDKSSHEVRAKLADTQGTCRGDSDIQKNPEKQKKVAPRCALCNEKAWPAYRGPCGHICCQTCWQEYIREFQQCPECSAHTKERHLVAVR